MAYETSALRYSILLLAHVRVHAIVHSIDYFMLCRQWSVWIVGCTLDMNPAREWGTEKIER